MPHVEPAAIPIIIEIVSTILEKSVHPAMVLIGTVFDPVQLRAETTKKTELRVVNLDTTKSSIEKMVTIMIIAWNCISRKTSRTLPFRAL